MSRNGSGVYSPPSANFPAVNGTIIEATDYNTVVNDLSSAMTQSVSVDGQSVVTNNIPMANHKLTGLSAGTANGDSVRFEQLAAVLASPAITGNASFAGNATFAGTVSVTGAATFNNRVDFKAGFNIASAATIDLTAATGNLINITGTTPTTAFIINPGQAFLLVPSASWPLVFNSTGLRINGGEDYTCIVNDRVYVYKTLNNVIYVDIIRDNGQPLSTSGLAPLASPVLTGNPTVPTAADGDNDTTIANTAFVCNGWFESTELTITDSALMSVAHGLGRTPKSFSAVLRCKVSEYGYSAGDEVTFDQDNTAASPTFTTAAGCFVNATHIKLKTTALNVMRLDSNSLSSITNSSWRVILRCR